MVEKVEIQTPETTPEQPTENTTPWFGEMLKIMKAQLQAMLVEH